MNDPAFQRHNRLQVNDARIHFIRGVKTVSGDARTNHIQMRIRHVDQSRTVGSMP